MLITIALLFMLFEGFSFSYVRQHSSDAGFNHHTRVHVMHYYYDALGDINAVNTALMYVHWPILKAEGLLTNRSISMLHRYTNIEVHRSPENGHKNIRYPQKTIF